MAAAAPAPQEKQGTAAGPLGGIAHQPLSETDAWLLGPASSPAAAPDPTAIADPLRPASAFDRAPIPPGSTGLTLEGSLDPTRVADPLRPLSEADRQLFARYPNVPPLIRHEAAPATAPTGGAGTKAFDEAFNTKLTPQEEAQFQRWKATYAPHDSGQDYDLRGAFKAGLTPDPQTGHWPDTFKKPNHPTFSNESQYAAYGRPGHWEGERYIPPAAPPGAPPREASLWGRGVAAAEAVGQAGLSALELPLRVAQPLFRFLSALANPVHGAIQTGVERASGAVARHPGESDAAAWLEGLQSFFSGVTSPEAGRAAWSAFISPDIKLNDPFSAAGWRGRPLGGGGGAAAGALGGGELGLLVSGPVGAVVGAGLGAAAGTVAGLSGIRPGSTTDKWVRGLGNFAFNLLIDELTGKVQGPMTAQLLRVAHRAGELSGLHDVPIPLPTAVGGPKSLNRIRPELAQNKRVAQIMAKHEGLQAPVQEAAIAATERANAAYERLDRLGVPLAGKGARGQRINTLDEYVYYWIEAGTTGAAYKNRAEVEQAAARLSQQPAIQKEIIGALREIGGSYASAWRTVGESLEKAGYLKPGTVARMGGHYAARMYEATSHNPDDIEAWLRYADEAALAHPQAGVADGARRNAEAIIGKAGERGGVAVSAKARQLETPEERAAHGAVLQASPVFGKSIRQQTRIAARGGAMGEIAQTPTLAEPGFFTTPGVPRFTSADEEAAGAAAAERLAALKTANQHMDRAQGAVTARRTAAVDPRLQPQQDAADQARAGYEAARVTYRREQTPGSELAWRRARDEAATRQRELDQARKGLTQGAAAPAAAPAASGPGPAAPGLAAPLESEKARFLRERRAATVGFAPELVGPPEAPSFREPKLTGQGITALRDNEARLPTAQTGTPLEIVGFRQGKSGRIIPGTGTFYGSDPSIAGGYGELRGFFTGAKRFEATGMAGAGGPEASLAVERLSFQNPLVVDGGHRELVDLIQKYGDDFLGAEGSGAISAAWQRLQKEGTGQGYILLDKAIARSARAAGFDGIVYRHGDEGAEIVDLLEGPRGPAGAAAAAAVAPGTAAPSVGVTSRAPAGLTGLGVPAGVVGTAAADPLVAAVTSARGELATAETALTAARRTYRRTGDPADQAALEQARTAARAAREKTQGAIDSVRRRQVKPGTPQEALVLEREQAIPKAEQAQTQAAQAYEAARTAYQQAATPENELAMLRARDAAEEAATAVPRAKRAYRDSLTMTDSDVLRVRREEARDAAIQWQNAENRLAEIRTELKSGPPEVRTERPTPPGTVRLVDRKYGPLNGMIVPPNVKKSLDAYVNPAPVDEGFKKLVSGLAGFYKSQAMFLAFPSLFHKVKYDSVLAEGAAKEAGVPFTPADVTTAARDLRRYRAGGAPSPAIAALAAETRAFVPRDETLGALGGSLRNVLGLGARNIPAKLLGVWRKGGKFVPETIGEIERSYKIALTQRLAAKYGYEEAARRAAETIGDWTMTDPTVRVIEKYGGIPFLTARAKAFPKMLSIALKHPEVLQRWGHPQLGPSLAAASGPGAVQTLPVTPPGAFPLPGTMDQEGREQWITRDPLRVEPFTDLLSLGSGIGGAAGLAAGALANVDVGRSFRRQEAASIVKPGEQPPLDSDEARFRFVADRLQPGVVRSAGRISRAVEGKTKFGGPYAEPETLAQAILGVTVGADLTTPRTAAERQLDAARNLPQAGRAMGYAQGYLGELLSGRKTPRVFPLAERGLTTVADTKAAIKNAQARLKSIALGRQFQGQEQIDELKKQSEWLFTLHTIATRRLAEENQRAQAKSQQGR